jgi:hypothetical protein
MGDIRFDEWFALGAIANRFVERNRSSLCVQYDLAKAAPACLDFDRPHQVGTDTTATGSGQHGDALGLAGILHRVQASGAYRFPAAVGDEVHAGGVEIVEFFFAGNTLFFDEHDPADFVAGREFRTRTGVHDADVSHRGVPLRILCGRCLQIGDAWRASMMTKQLVDGNRPSSSVTRLVGGAMSGLASSLRDGSSGRDFDTRELGG